MHSSSVVDLNDDRAASVSEIRLEQVELHTDEELRRLSEYFERGRDEIQKKVDLLLSQEIRMNSNVERPSSSESNMSASSAATTQRSFRPITLAIAKKLREFTVGSCVHSLSSEWKSAKFSFMPASQGDELLYGLYSSRNSSRGLILSVQAILLKNLLLFGYKDIHGRQVSSSEWRNDRKILKPNDLERKEVLVRTLAELLWKAGEGKYACVVLDSGRNCFDYKNSEKTNYFGDGITEKLHLYDFNDVKSLEEFIKKNLSAFQRENGCILFMYSLILSRNFDNIEQDLQGSVLIGDMEECKMGLYNLVLTGMATPHIHNGACYYDKDGESLEKPTIGIGHRNDVGILYWDPKENPNKRTEVGSMLKTPKYPIWLGLMGKNLVCVIFNTNVELMNDWRLEQNFSLHFYSGLLKQENEFKIEIMNRNTNDLIVIPKINKHKYSAAFSHFEHESEPEIISLIKTKWPDCEITNTDGKDIMQLL